MSCIKNSDTVDSAGNVMYKEFRYSVYCTSITDLEKEKACNEGSCRSTETRTWGVCVAGEEMAATT